MNHETLRLKVENSLNNKRQEPHFTCDCDIIVLVEVINLSSAECSITKIPPQSLTIQGYFELTNTYKRGKSIKEIVLYY